RYSYTLYDNQGELVAHSLTQFLSSGFLFHSLTDIDVWDANNQYIGTISGKFWTNSRAKFDFFNSKGAHFGAAHLNTETTNFIIAANTGKGMKPIGGLEAEGYGDMSAITVKLKRNFQDDRMLKIFAAFISDYHDYFVVKPEINNYNIDFGSSRD
ncbi:MAG: hypothetical protein P0S94_02970, partial [Simkaniaceae bacterium]|nr:hypothetical protein [Simkaniaceae bacterium]